MTTQYLNVKTKYGAKRPYNDCNLNAAAAVAAISQIKLPSSINGN